MVPVTKNVAAEGMPIAAVAAAIVATTLAAWAAVKAAIDTASETVAAAMKVIDAALPAKAKE